MDYRAVCLDVCELAREAGAYIARQRERFTFSDVEFKGAQNLVSYVDKQTERTLVERLKALVPEAEFVTEEGTVSAAGGASRLKWIVDPLDGTTNFVHGLSPYCVSIALTEEDEPVVGVVYEVTRDEMFYAWRGSYAYLNGERIVVSQTDRLENSLIAIGFAYGTVSKTDGFIDSLIRFQNTTNGVRRLGSAAADLAYVACGRFDAFFHEGLSPWDVAAGAFGRYAGRGAGDRLRRRERLFVRPADHRGYAGRVRRISKAGQMTSSERIQYRLLWGVSRVAGWLPRGLLYRGFAPMVCWVLHRVVRYRVSVVRTNLANAFPEKSREELRDIERRFYRHLSEVFIDTILLGSISRREILERMVYRDVEKQEELMRGRSWISAMSHFGSWELTINYVCHTDHRVFAVYRPLHNAVVDRFYHSARSRFGTQPVPMNDIFKETIAARLSGGKPVIVALIADQTPPWHEIKHWYRFLEQDTPFFSGIEKMALKLKMPVYFMHVRKVAPRHYEAEFKLVYDGVEPVAEHQITERYIALLEAMIRESPELWMWSHRRWKHKKPADYDMRHSRDTETHNIPEA